MSILSQFVDIFEHCDTGTAIQTRGWDWAAAGTGVTVDTNVEKCTVKQHGLIVIAQFQV